ncbi:MAG: alpha-L-fucosidase [Bacteroidales bacterium]|nr:alpha-L-fucosidase [Bacteroidales bacterium]
MNKRFIKLIVAAVCFCCSVQAQDEPSVAPPKPFGPVPTAAQLAWQQMEMNMFCHFGPNTFTGKEWGDGTEIEDIFNPTALNCDQWAAVAKSAGFKGIIITAKHHDGFCLWPNPVSEHTVAQSNWRNGQGDVLRELSDACRKADLKFGVYISPWDRNAPTYGSPAYNETFLQTLQSALTQYGPIYEQWFDGANGEGPNGKKQVYDWPAFNGQVYKLQPNAVIFSDVGPGCRWMGNEQGVNGRTCWSRLDIAGYEPGALAPTQDTLNVGNYNGANWIPAETDVSIRPGWFYRDSEHPKTLQELLKIYYTSVGRNSLLLLNVPPDQRGRIATEDSARLVEFRQALDQIFADDLAKHSYIVSTSNYRFQDSHSEELKNQYKTIYAIYDDDYDIYWATDDSVHSAYVELEYVRPLTFNRVLLQEYIPLGQRVEQFHIEVMNEDGTWRTIAEETTIGYKRIVLTEKVTTKKVRIVIDKSRACIVLNKIGLYLDTISKFDTL